MSKIELTQAQVDELFIAFNEFDVNGDGTITHEEIHTLLKQHCMDGGECLEVVEDFFKKYDTNHDNVITFEEYLKIYKENLAWEQRKKNVFNLFLEFDVNGDGKISDHEALVALKRMHTSLSDAEIQEVFEKVDISHDGTIDFDEFYRLIKQF